jgi:hypothetical protein
VKLFDDELHRQYEAQRSSVVAEILKLQAKMPAPSWYVQADPFVVADILPDLSTVIGVEDDSINWVYTVITREGEVKRRIG